VNWNVKLMALKFLNASGSGTIGNAARAINWAVTAKQAGVNVRVLNNSWGCDPGLCFSNTLLNAITNANNNGILFVAAAGNAGNNNDVTPTYPCNYNVANVVCVAATNMNDQLASFSSYGATSVDLAAPGVNVESTVRVVDGSYGTFSGTSMATPHVTGSAALILAQQPGLSVSQLKAKLLAAVDSVGSLSGKVATGGRLDVCKAITGC
jgi:subtilisin family serine protease